MQRLLADYKEHILFITEMKSLIETDEVAKDVAGAEMLIERHQEHKVQHVIHSGIDAALLYQAI